MADLNPEGIPPGFELPSEPELDLCGDAVPGGVLRNDAGATGMHCKCQSGHKLSHECGHWAGKRKFNANAPDLKHEGCACQTDAAYAKAEESHFADHDTLHEDDEEEEEEEMDDEHPVLDGEDEFYDAPYYEPEA